MKHLALPVSIKPKVIVDGGAYTGLSTVYFAKKYPKAKIIAIEPEESNFNILKLNTHKFKNVIPIRAAIWKEKTYLELLYSEQGYWATTAREVKNKTIKSVRAITVVDIIKDNNDQIDILKLDVEGAEKEIFSNKDISWLENLRVLIIELH